MSTHANIAFYDNKTKLVYSIYLHWDGYREYAGRMLLEHYTTEEKVCELIVLGDLSSIAPSTETIEGHSFVNPVNGYCIAYGRDRGETGTDAFIQNYRNFKTTLFEDYTYLFANGRWTKVTKSSLEYLSLTQEEQTKMHDSYFQPPGNGYFYA